jgi:hypothetical protein
MRKKKGRIREYSANGKVRKKQAKQNKKDPENKNRKSTTNNEY